MNKKTVEHSKILGERLFFDISSPLTPTLWSKKHWLLVIEESMDYVLFSKKSELKI